MQAPPLATMSYAYQRVSEPFRPEPVRDSYSNVGPGITQAKDSKQQGYGPEIKPLPAVKQFLPVKPR